MPNTKSVDELLEKVYANATAQFQTVEPYDYWIIDGTKTGWHADW
jgi:hypothetical protein